MLPAPVIRTTAALMMVPDATLTSLSGIYSMDACVAVDPFSALEDAGFLNRHIHRYLALNWNLSPISLRNLRVRWPYGTETECYSAGS